MSSALFQDSLSSSTMIVIAVVMVLMAIGIVILLFAKSSIQKREREGHARERMLEMERESHFAAAADRVPITRDPADIAIQILQLLREHLSIDVLAVYSGRASDGSFKDVLSRSDGETGLPASLPASVLSEYTRPGVVRLSAITGQPQPDTRPVEEQPVDRYEPPLSSPADSEGEISDSVTVESPSDNAESSADQEVDTELAEANGATLQSENQVAMVQRPDTVAVLPWQGPFDWTGLIVASAPQGVALGLFDPYREPLRRLTDKLAVGLDLQRSDLLNEAAEQRSSRTTNFARSLILSLDQPSPLDAIVRQLTELLGSDSAAIWRLDETSGMVRMSASYGLSSTEFLPLPIGQGLAGNVAHTGQVLAIEDAPGDPRCIFPREARESGIISYLGAPLSSGNKSLGVIEVHSGNRRTWTEDDQHTLESAASIVAEVIKSTDSRGNRIRVESAYLGLSESLQRLRSADEVKEAVVEVLGHALAASRVIIVELNDQGQPEPAMQEYRQKTVKSALGTVFGNGLLTGVAASESGQPVAIARSREHSLAGAETAAELSVLSEIAAPISVEGKTRAIVYVHQCDRVREWEPEEVEFAERVVRQVSLSLSNLSALHAAFTEARRARADAQRAGEISREAPTRIKELEETLAGIERALHQSRSAESEARSSLEKTSMLEATARAEADALRRSESESKQQLERLQEEHKQTRGSAQQLLEINRLKSEFIVNAGHEMEASLQSVLGLAELLERGSYGRLSPEQQDAVRTIYGSARRIKNDIDWLIEYGSSRSRRLEPSGGD